MNHGSKCWHTVSGLWKSPTDGSATQIRVLLDEVDPDRVKVESFTVQTATLDDVFFTLTGHVTPQLQLGAEVVHV